MSRLFTVAMSLAHSMLPPHSYLVHPARTHGKVGDSGPEPSLAGISESHFLPCKLYVHRYLNFSVPQFTYLQNMNVGNNNYLINCNESYMRVNEIIMAANIVPITSCMLTVLIITITYEEEPLFAQFTDAKN